MSASNQQIDVQSLPGIGQPTSMIETSHDAKLAFSPTANYLRVAAGEHTSTHVSSGEVLLFCVAGAVDVTVDGHHHEMQPNQMLHVGASLPYRVDAREESALLVTTLFAEHVATIAANPNLDRNNEVDEALEETFPASDPPSYNTSSIS